MRCTGRRSGCVGSPRGYINIAARNPVPGVRNNITAGVAQKQSRARLPKRLFIPARRVYADRFDPAAFSRPQQNDRRMSARQYIERSRPRPGTSAVKYFGSFRRLRDNIEGCGGGTMQNKKNFLFSFLRVCFPFAVLAEPVAAARLPGGRPAPAADRPILYTMLRRKFDTVGGAIVPTKHCRCRGYCNRR